MRRPARFWILLASALLRPASGAAAEKTWIEARSAHFSVMTDAGQGKARTVLYDLEQLRRLITEFLPQQPVASHVPAAFYAFENEKSMRGFQPLRDGKPEDWGAYFRPTGFKTFIAIRVEADKDFVRELVFQQYLHLLLSYSDVRYPLWLGNGFALFYGNAYVTKGYAEVGKMHPRHRRELGEFRSMPLQELLAVDYDSPWYRDDSRRALFDAQSWALMHYLLVGRNPDGAAALGKFLGFLADGKDQVLAFQESMGMPLAEIEAAISSYIRKSISLYLKVPLAPLDLDRDFTVTELPPALAEARLGELLIGVGRRDEARARLSAAVEADSSLADAYEGLGFLSYIEKNMGQARAFFERAVANGSTNPMVHFYFAESLLDEYQGTVSEIPSAIREAARLSLAKTLESAPSHADAARLFGFLCLFGDREAYQEGVAVVTKALETHRGHTWLEFVLGQLYARQENYTAARSVYQGLLKRELPPDMVASVRRQLDYVNARIQ